MKTITRQLSRFVPILGKDSLPFFAALLALILFSGIANAQWYADTIAATNHVPATSTNATVNAIIDATQLDEFPLQIVGRLASGTDTSAVAYTVQRSVDKVNWVTVFALPVTANGTNWVTAMTNVTAQAYPWWKISAIGNPNGAAWTNAVVTAGAKRNVLKYSY